MNLLEWHQIGRVAVLAIFALTGEAAGFYMAYLAFKDYIEDLREALRVLEK